jgi:hypothetical protein
MNRGNRRCRAHISLPPQGVQHLDRHTGVSRGVRDDFRFFKEDLAANHPAPERASRRLVGSHRPRCFYGLQPERCLTSSEEAINQSVPDSRLSFASLVCMRHINSGFAL